MFLAHLALQTLGLVMDGRVRGRGGVARRLHVVYKGRALPLAWRVRQGKKGHCPEAFHLALVEQGQKLIPAGASVVLLGDGACDGVDLQHPLDEAGWSSVCRTGMHMTASWDGATFRRATLGVCRKPGPLIAFKEGRFPGEASGPIMRIGGWAKGDHDPLYVVTPVPSAEPACRGYEKRFRIEPCFADQKRRGFPLHKSHRAAPKRFSRLLMAAC